ncbi:Uu.00g124390.m01.CDS01 [Anthostomella pinea]|uniref:Uu.00g124390.m01.CDS01 n=1 Tax=Anthostomella pinea TaxID=933095 RepID=A0AAI8VHK3_9PEZI|nr:Uu.00g124390.m01.CDS01 [Anthostomella pinea]
MHILVINDDGPPSPKTSPYVHSLVRALQQAGHTVSVCLPHTQRSWIGKAHMIGQTVKPLYYRAPETFDPREKTAPATQGTTHARPSRGKDVQEEWILVDGTPASCAQIGLHHFFNNRGPVDLVVSGPNYGRNTTALFALSSGTLGGALEAAVCRTKAVALSWAFFRTGTPDAAAASADWHDPEVIAAATRRSVKVVEKLYAQWPADGSVDLYSVNVPLTRSLEDRAPILTPMLQNYWAGGGGACFQEVEGSVGDEEEEEERIREGEGEGEAAADGKADGGVEKDGEKGYTHRHFRWKPRFEDVYQSVRDAAPGNDGWAVDRGLTRDNHKSEELPSATTMIKESTLAHRPENHFYALIAYEDAYVQPLILDALEQLFPPESYTLLSLPTSQQQQQVQHNGSGSAPDADEGVISLPDLLPDPDARVLQLTPYEAIDWDYAAAHPRTCLVNSYMLRKALIRKHYLAATVEHWAAKRPTSVLASHVGRSEAFELDYAEFLDDALVEAFDLRASLGRNEGLYGEGEEDNGDGGESAREWWILKPSMSDRGQGIRLFSTMAELQAIFDEWEAERPDSEDEDEDEGDDDDDDEDGNTGTAGSSSRDQQQEADDYITTSHLRHFVAQPYIHPPLLLPGCGNRKFHIRTYVACVGALDVYVYRQMLALFAAKPYVAPRSAPCQSPSHSHPNGPDTNSSSSSALDLEAHLTNTCLQRSVADGTVQSFWQLPASSLPTSSKQKIFAQISEIAGQVFEAAARGMMMHFRPQGNAFEVFGVDFLVDADEKVWLLEVNAFPDFRQTGDELTGLVGGLWRGVLGRAVGGFFGVGESGKGEEEDDGLVLVRRVELGR